VVTRGLLENIVLWLLGRWPPQGAEELPWGSVAVKDLAAERRKLMEEIGRLREERNKTMAEIEELRARLGGAAGGRCGRHCCLWRGLRRGLGLWRWLPGAADGAAAGSGGGCCREEAAGRGLVAAAEVGPGLSVFGC